MNIERLVRLGRRESYVHLERYVNDGSPSGFTDVHTTSFETNPFTGKDGFPLLEFEDHDIDVEIIGVPPEILMSGVSYAHPDSSESERLLGAGRSLIPTSFVVSPASGGRTMFLPGESGFIKLTYETRIGRVDRQLTRAHCLSSIEVSQAIQAAIDTGMLPASAAMLRETGARVAFLESAGEERYEWGTLYREMWPYPSAPEIRHVIPAFSLFGGDRKSPEDGPLLCEIVRLSGVGPYRYALELCRMILDVYWAIVKACGMHVEAHAQNCLVEFDAAWLPTRFVIKDMDSVDKDLQLAGFLGLRTEWASFPYMCFNRDLVWYYPLRASYMYDFKLGEYLLEPILICMAEEFGLDVVALRSELRGHVRANYLDGLPPAYFPSDDCWYDCDNTERMPGKRREYFAHPNPKFR